MATFKLDGREIPYEPGDTIIRAAWRQGIEIPHYCWHPGLTIAANCRMCLVEVTSGKPMMMPILRWDPQKQDYVETTKPKLVPACQQTIVPGLEVSTSSETVKEVQSGVQELLLLNHPVDCPICDQAGECKLQDYWLEHQQKLKRKREEIVHKPKAVPFGPTIVYDAERCIVCTRCVRFCDEVVKDHVLDMRERGNRNEIVLSPGRQLDHKYTLMTEHVCPVGALTSKDFRFKARVWFLRSAPSVCNGCATGCNTWMDYDPRYQRVYRLRPRDNAQVNQYWMCDDGMMTYKGVHEDRIFAGRLRDTQGVREVSTDEALASAAKSLGLIDGKRVAVVLSAQSSNEDNFALARLARQGLGTSKVYLAARGGWEGDAILRHADDNPNRAGATAVAGGEIAPLQDLLEDVLGGEVDGAILLGSVSTETVEQLAPLRKLRVVVSLTSHEGTLSQVASVVVPIAGYGETSGIFVNAKGVAQQFRRAVPAPPGVKAGWETVAALAKAASLSGVDFASLAEVRAAMPGDKPAPLPNEARVKLEARV